MLSLEPFFPTKLLCIHIRKKREKYEKLLCVCDNIYIYLEKRKKERKKLDYFDNHFFFDSQIQKNFEKQQQHYSRLKLSILC